MKTRHGFVSNSSTTSFLLAFKKPIACPHCKQTPFDFLKVLNGGFIDTDVPCLIENENSEIEELERNKKWLEKNIDLYNHFEKDLAKDMVDFIIRTVQNYEINKRYKFVENATKKKMNDQVKSEDEDYKFRISMERHRDQSRPSLLDETLKYMRRDLEEINRKILEKTEKIEKLKKYNSGEWNIVCGKVDYMTIYYSKIIAMVEDGMFEVIERVDS